MIEPARNRINSQSAVLYSAIGIGAAILVSGLIVVAAGKPATALPAYAAHEVGDSSTGKTTARIRRSE